jgi:hypothetical protein
VSRLKWIPGPPPSRAQHAPRAPAAAARSPSVRRAATAHHPGGTPRQRWPTATASGSASLAVASPQGAPAASAPRDLSAVAASARAGPRPARPSALRGYDSQRAEEPSPRPLCSGAGVGGVSARRSRPRGSQAEPHPARLEVGPRRPVGLGVEHAPAVPGLAGDGPGWLCGVSLAGGHRLLLQTVGLTMPGKPETLSSKQ